MAIKQEANRLKMKYQTTDPYDICTSMDIQVIKRPMGASAQSCKGFFPGLFSVQADRDQQ